MGLGFLDEVALSTSASGSDICHIWRRGCSSRASMMQSRCLSPMASILQDLEAPALCPSPGRTSCLAVTSAAVDGSPSRLTHCVVCLGAFACVGPSALMPFPAVSVSFVPVLQGPPHEPSLSLPSLSSPALQCLLLQFASNHARVSVSSAPFKIPRSRNLCDSVQVPINRS